jgi:ABC-type sugar transport system substrate-binding protein
VLIAKLDSYKTVLLKGVVDHGKTINGLTINEVVANGQREEQLAALHELANRKADAIIIALSDGDIGPYGTKVAEDAKITLVFRQ